MSYSKKLKEHWLISAILLLGVVLGMTWLISVNQMGTKSRIETSIEVSGTQSSDISKIDNNPNNETTVLKKGASFTSKFGFNIYISNSNDELKNAAFFISLKDQKDKNFRNIGIGQKVKIIYDNNSYSIEINDIRDSLVDITIRKDA
ncbi:hypothetical protein [Malonomonas rubra]|uniref:hypothetical protein n=1 Tax=Malonomonas rubra TaxID=57040 RepID=UPI0026E933EA|nr:hypothetical protein [Malonomonas rubra]